MDVGFWRSCNRKRRRRNKTRLVLRSRLSIADRPQRAIDVFHLILQKAGGSDSRRIAHGVVRESGGALAIEDAGKRGRCAGRLHRSSSAGCRSCAHLRKTGSTLPFGTKPLPQRTGTLGAGSRSTAAGLCAVVSWRGWNFVPVMASALWSCFRRCSKANHNRKSLPPRFWNSRISKSRVITPRTQSRSWMRRDRCSRREQFSIASIYLPGGRNTKPNNSTVRRRLSNRSLILRHRWQKHL